MTLPLALQDKPIVGAMRANMMNQKGKIFGAKGRSTFAAIKSSVPPAPEVRCEPGALGGIPGWWCLPKGARSDARLLYFHGGCYVLGTAEAFCNQASHFAHLTRTATFIPDYRLAPEHPFPAAVDDAWAAYQGLAASHTGAIGLIGESAGGGLALTTLLLAASKAASGLRQACGAAVMSPWTDLALTGASMQERAEADPLFTQEVLAAFVADFMQGADARDPHASPFYASPKGFPPLRIDVGNDEILLDDSTRYAEKARAEGVEVTLAVWEGMPHGFQSAIGKLDAATQAVVAASKFLVERVEAS